MLPHVNGKNAALQGDAWRDFAITLGKELPQLGTADHSHLTFHRDSGGEYSKTRR